MFFMKWLINERSLSFIFKPGFLKKELEILLRVFFLKKGGGTFMGNDFDHLVL